MSRLLLLLSSVISTKHTVMHVKFNLGLFLLALIPFEALASPAATQDAKSQIKAEIDRLQHSLKEKPITDPDYAPIGSMASQSLEGAAVALDSGKLYLSLEKLLQAEDFLQGARFPVEKAEAVKSGLPAFESEWGKVSQILAAYDREVRKKDWGASPTALRALSETALGRSVPLLEGGRGFAVSTKPSDGLLYLGQAQGEAAFAQFSSTLPLRRNAAPILLRSYLPELQKLQSKTNAAFQPPRSIQLHDRFIALNSSLKLAQELDAQKSYAGSLYQYLEATRHFGMLDAPPVEATRQFALKEAIAAALKNLSASRQDDSIAQLFLERVASQITHADGSATTADEWRSAQVILDQVLPAYGAAQKPAVPLEQASGKTVDVTLVRWPYTWNISDPASLLVQEVASQYPGRVSFVTENFGASKLADKFGVKGYPAIFVDDILVAAPREFGYFGEVEGSGRYAPWRSEASQAKFKADLVRMIDLILAGKKDIVTREHSWTNTSTHELAALPQFKLTDLSGHPLTAGELSGRVVLVEFWATWCPPCRSTLEWLGELKRKHGDKLAILALAVESPEDQIRSTVASLSPDLQWAITDTQTAQSFGDITAVPTLFLFDRSGKTSRVLYGAPPDLHEQVEQSLGSLLQ